MSDPNVTTPCVEPTAEVPITREEIISLLKATNSKVLEQVKTIIEPHHNVDDPVIKDKVKAAYLKYLDDFVNINLKNRKAYNHRREIRNSVRDLKRLAEDIGDNLEMM
jgi:hypothetical protein